MRELTLAECGLASGGHAHTQLCGWGSDCNFLDDVIVNGELHRYGTYGPPSGPPPPDGGGGGGVGEPQPSEPDCHDVNEVGLANGVPVPDGAKYYVPESLTQKYLDDALAHLKSFDPVTNLLGLMNEFREMYRDASHPHFLDFKRWDTAHPGEANPTVTYWSDAEGAMVSGSAFEAFGNFIYGAFGTIAGIPAEVLKAAAGWTQEGGSGGILDQIGGAITFADDARDKPHVQIGIQAGDLYKYSGQPIANPIVGGSCGSGGDGSGAGSGDTGGSGGGDPGGYTPPNDGGSYNIP